MNDETTNQPASSRWKTTAAIGVLVTLGLVVASVLTLSEPWPHPALVAAVSGLVVSFCMAGFVGWVSRRTRVLEEAVQNVEHQALHDTLTGLPNRAGLLRQLEVSVHEIQRDDTALGVLFLDLDRFKMVNDSMGHETGDELLRQVATRLRQAVRASDVVARFGGDEFVVLCRGLLNVESSIAIARQVLAAFEEPMILKGGTEHVVTPSIGIATADLRHPRTPRELVRDADAAMYRAKRAKSGFAVFDEAQRKDVISRLDVERELRSAIEESKLDVYYQPIVEAGSRSIVSLEALVRWNRDGYGIVAPGDFLGVAEEAGLMQPIGELVLRESCAQAALWHHGLLRGRRVRVGVNVAERQLIESAFVTKVAKVLEWSGLHPALLTLEITEDLVIDHLDSALSVLRDLKRLGVDLAIDDFGTGQSSLSYIRKLDMVDSLKIDKEFVQGLGNDPVNEAIVDAITSLARAVGLTVVAEGVETEHQYRILTDLGVHQMQGYLFARPMHAGDLEAKLLGAPRAPEPPPPAAAAPLVPAVPAHDRPAFDWTASHGPAADRPATDWPAADRA